MTGIDAICRVIYVGIAESSDGDDSADKRFKASLLLTVASFSFLLTLILALKKTYDVDLFGWIADIWPWRYEDFRGSRRNPAALGSLVVYGIPLFIVWHLVGRRYIEDISSAPSGAVAKIVVGAWLMMSFVGTLYLSGGLGYHWAAVACHPVLGVLLFLWFRLSGAARHAA